MKSLTRKEIKEAMRVLVAMKAQAIATEEYRKATELQDAIEHLRKAVKP